MWGTKAKVAGNSGTPANAVRQLRGVAAALVALLVPQCIGAVAQAAADLSYTPDQIVAVLQSVGDSYARDHGAGLLKEAFD